MSKQNQMKDFPQNSCRANRVVIMNIGPLQDLNTVETRM